MERLVSGTGNGKSLHSSFYRTFVCGMMNYMTVTEKARKAVCLATVQVIDESGLSDYRVAALTGLNRSALSRYRSGIRSPGDPEIAAIETALDIPEGTIDSVAAEILENELAVAS